MSQPITLPGAEAVVKSARTYVIDLIERVIWAFLGAAAAVALAAGPADCSPYRSGRALARPGWPQS
ncbi:hypothetical protein [Streptomyces achromogenes]|uniref:hypothetical protein n=1 Tax=Streptomyces achromogenes TaxID=67255 RepID=UPI0034497FE3